MLKILISVTLDDHSLQNSTLSSILCQHVNGTHNNRLQDFSARALDTILTQWPHTYRRSEMTNCMNGQVLLQIRAENTNVADDIHNDISSNRFNDVIIKKGMNGSASLGSGLLLSTFVNRSEFQSYRDVYITFQSEYDTDYCCCIIFSTYFAEIKLLRILFNAFKSINALETLVYQRQKKKECMGHFQWKINNL